MVTINSSQFDVCKTRNTVRTPAQVLVAMLNVEVDLVCDLWSLCSLRLYAEEGCEGDNEKYERKAVQHDGGGYGQGMKDVAIEAPTYSS